MTKNILTTSSLHQRKKERKKRVGRREGVRTGVGRCGKIKQKFTPRDRVLT